MKKRILCYGDSNTYGYIPGGGRYDENTRWPMALQNLLGRDEYTVVEEGFGGRTTVYDDPVEGGFKSGQAYLPPCLMSHNPLDLVVLMLGTNDAKHRFQGNAKIVANCNRILIDTIRQYGADNDGTAPRILLVAPIRIGENVANTDMSIFGEYSVGVAAGFSSEFARVAEEAGVAFLDAATVLEPSEEDCIHVTAEGHLALAEAVCTKVRELLP